MKQYGACEGKQTFRTYEEAARVAARKEKRRAYRCDKCAGFHVGTNFLGRSRRPRIYDYGE